MNYELKDYSVKNELKNQNDEELMDEFMNYSQGYICDIISEIADNNVGIYNDDVFEQAFYLNHSGAYDNAKAEGLIDGTQDLVKQLQGAWWYYNERVLYDNLNAMVYNYAINYLNKINKILTDEQLAILEYELEEDINGDSKIEEIIEWVKYVIENEINNRRD